MCSDSISNNDDSIISMKTIKVLLALSMWICSTSIVVLSIVCDTMTTSSRVNGVCVGCILVLVALGLTLVFKPFNKQYYDYRTIIINNVSSMFNTNMYYNVMQ